MWYMCFGVVCWIVICYWRVSWFDYWRIQWVLIGFGFGNLRDFRDWFYGLLLYGLSILLSRSFMISILIWELKGFMNLRMTYLSIWLGSRLNYDFETFEKFYKRFLGDFLSDDIEMVLLMKCRISSLLVLLLYINVLYGWVTIRVLYSLSSIADSFPYGQCYLFRLLSFG